MYYKITFLTKDNRQETVLADSLEEVFLKKGKKFINYRLRPGSFASGHLVKKNEFFEKEESSILSVQEIKEKEKI